MEDTISTVSAARAAGCSLECEVDAYCAARWHCDISEAQRRRPSVFTRLWRISSDEVVLSLETESLPVLPWCKVVRMSARR